jgi:predicted ATPase
VPAAWNEIELELQLQLAQVCIAKLGYDSKEAAVAFVRANSLLHIVNRPDLLVPARYGIWIGHYLRAEHEAAYPLVEKLVKDIEHSKDPVAKLVSNRMMAATLVSLGEPLRARQHLELALDLYQPDFMTRFAENFAQEPGIQIRAYYILSLYLLGYPDQANNQLEISKDVAAQLRHVNTTCYGAMHWCIIGFMNRNEELARESNQVMLDLAQQHGMYTWLAYGQFGQALLQSRDGDLSALDRLTIAFSDYVAEGDFLFVSFYRTEQVREFLRHNQTDTALDAYQQTLDIINKTHERWYLPELYRLHGEINIALEQPKQAEKSFQLAISTARKQDAKSLELRASTSLAQLWVEQGEVKNALVLLQPIYDWFSEGFDTPDLVDARTLLQQYD